MKVRMTHEIPDDYRRAINHYVGKPGLATRLEIITHIDGVLDADAQDLGSEVNDGDEQ